MNIRKEAAIDRISDVKVFGSPICPDVVEGLKALISTLSPCAFLPVPDFDPIEAEAPKTLPVEIRFKAGDIVRCVKRVVDSDRVIGQYGIVIARDSMGRIGCDWFEFTDGHGLSGFSRQPGHGFWVAPEALEFVTHVAPYDGPLQGNPYPEPDVDKDDEDDDEY